MLSVVILQARTNSSRLPAKVLLPVAGIPLSVLAAKRAGNTGREVVIATSTEASDDLLASTLDQNEVKVFRGSLNNTLSRFVTALEKYEDNTIVIRLTADNPIPDGTLLDKLEQQYLQSGADYMHCSNVTSGLPYGVSAEIMRLEHLREANSNTSTPFDLEHVTPYIKRNYSVAAYQEIEYRNLSLYRCTIDAIEDYLPIANLFLNSDNPIGETYLTLIDRLVAQTPSINPNCNADKLVIGGAQLGLAYGINNRTGKPSPSIARAIIEKAVDHGCNYIDTARIYGNSEEIIGKSLSTGYNARVRIVTKLSDLASIDSNSSKKHIDSEVERSILQSCYALNKKKLDVLLLHRTNHLTDFQGAIWESLLEHYRKGLISSLGASVQSPNELIAALDKSEITFIQMPFNILDTRWCSAIEKLKEIKKQREVVVHTRSALLQGILVSDNEHLWKKTGISNSREIIDWLKMTTASLKQPSITSLCITYVRSQEWIDGITVGMETIDQLNENLTLFSQPLFSGHTLNHINSSRPDVTHQALDPSNWG